MKKIYLIYPYYNKTSIGLGLIHYKERNLLGIYFGKIGLQETLNR